LAVIDSISSRIWVDISRVVKNIMTILQGLSRITKLQ
jgi:hypothetical protein